MSETPSLSQPLDDVTAASGIAYPNGQPYSHITFALVAWNESARLGQLLSRVRPVFGTIIVGVQASDDGTRAIAAEYADVVVDDTHRGFGDATFGPLVLPKVETKWVLKLDADEWPSDDLLDSLSSATWYAEQSDIDGVWLPFQSSVEGIEYEEQHSHLRLFRSTLDWPAKLHSRPDATKHTLWQTGHIRHDRSLDELVTDYLRYFHIGRGNSGWDAHNVLMMRSACLGVAEVKGWPFVQSHVWWPEVQSIVFVEEQPWLQSPSSPPVETSRPRARSAKSPSARAPRTRPRATAPAPTRPAQK